MTARSVRGTYKIAMPVVCVETGKVIGGQTKVEVAGEVLCDGVFGVQSNGPYFNLTHIPTGKRVGGWFETPGRAKRCARALYRLPVDWHFKTNAERDKIRRGPHMASIKETVKAWQMRQEVIE